VCRLLALDNTPLTLELALSLVTRLVTRGMPEMIQAVKGQPGMLAALETVLPGRERQRAQQEEGQWATGELPWRTALGVEA